MHEMGAVPEPLLYGLLVVAGALAGVINSLAGGGSLLLLPALMAAGLPPSVANGTLRVSIVVQSAMSSWTFRRRGHRVGRAFAWLLVPIASGAVAGSVTATYVPDRALRSIFGVVFVLWGIFLGVGRRSRPTPSPDVSRRVGWGTAVGAFVVGAYGGLVQAGVGFPLIALLVGGAGCTLVEANAVKAEFVAVYSSLSLVIFASAGMVAWAPGAAVAAGGLVGGWLGVRLQLRSSARSLRWFLVIAVSVSGVAMVIKGLAASG